MSVAIGHIDPDHLVLYNYTPSAVAAYAFMGIFGLGTAVHFFYLFKLRQAFFIPLIIGGISMYIYPWYSAYLTTTSGNRRILRSSMGSSRASQLQCLCATDASTPSRTNLPRSNSLHVLSTNRHSLGC